MGSGSGGGGREELNWVGGLEVGVEVRVLRWSERNKVASVPGNNKCWKLLAKGVVPAGCWICHFARTQMTGGCPGNHIALSRNERVCGTQSEWHIIYREVRCSMYRIVRKWSMETAQGIKMYVRWWCVSTMEMGRRRQYWSGSASCAVCYIEL